MPAPEPRSTAAAATSHRRTLARSAPVWIVLAACGLILLVWLLAWERVTLLRTQAIAFEQAKNENLVLAHTETLQGQISAVDQLLQFVRQDFATQGPGLDIRRKAALSTLPTGDLIAVTVLDEKGVSVLSTLDNRGLDFADRDMYRHHLANAEDRLYIGPPVQGRTTGAWVVTLSRRIEKPDGGFGGAVLAAVDPAAFSRVYERATLGPAGSLALIGLDGITRVRRNAERISYGELVRQSQLFTELKSRPSGSYVAVAASDGVRRVVSYRQMDAHPMVVVVASSLADLASGTRADERTAWLTAALASVLLAGLTGLSLLVLRRNVQTFAAVASAELQQRMLLEHSFDAILRTRPDGQVLKANAAACRLFQMDEPELAARGRTGLVDTDDPRLAALLRERAVHGRAEGRLRMKRKDGSTFEAQVSSVVYTDADGQAASSLTVRDLTVQIEADAERARYDQRLRETQKLESIGTLAGGIAHDFNNILAAILGNASVLRGDVGDGHPGAQSVRRIEQAGLRGRALVQQILTFSRRGAEQRVPQPLQPLLQESVALLRATLPASVQLELDVMDLPLVCECDSTQIQQVLLNLCTNAWQAMPQQRGRIRVTLAEADPEARPSGAPRCALLQVADDGEGMDEATRARLFEPFFTTKPVGKGTGLGLSVVHGIVTRHGGSVAVRSQPGQGTVFEIRLPLVDQAIEAPVSAGSIPTPAGQGQRVLYVDDDPVLTVTVETLLLQAGWRAVTCGHASEALERIRADPDAFDLLITDYNMPGQSGLQLVAAARAIAPRLPLIVTSGYVSDELLAQARAAGVQRVLPKEHLLERLAQTVRECLSDA